MIFAEEASICPCIPRKPSKIHPLHQYDGNLISVFILGGVVALTGACPGTVLVQSAASASSGVSVLGSVVLSTMLWAQFGYCAKFKRIGVLLQCRK
jgi:hypothetical protein